MAYRLSRPTRVRSTPVGRAGGTKVMRQQKVGKVQAHGVPTRPQVKRVGQATQQVRARTQGRKGRVKPKLKGRNLAKKRGSVVTRRGV